MGGWGGRSNTLLHSGNALAFLTGSHLIIYGDDVLVQGRSGEQEVLGVVHVQGRHRPVAVLDPRADRSLLKERKKNGKERTVSQASGWIPLVAIQGCAGGQGAHRCQ